MATINFLIDSYHHANVKVHMHLFIDNVWNIGWVDLALVIVNCVCITFQLNTKWGKQLYKNIFSRLKALKLKYILHAHKKNIRPFDDL